MILKLHDWFRTDRNGKKMEGFMNIVSVFTTWLVASEILLHISVIPARASWFFAVVGGFYLLIRSIGYGWELWKAVQEKLRQEGDKGSSN